MKKFISILILVMILVIFSEPKSFGYDRATEDKYPMVMGPTTNQTKRFQFNLLGGTIFNQAYLDTQVVGAGVAYGFSKWSRIGIGLRSFANTSNGTRICLEQDCSTSQADVPDDTPKPPFKAIYVPVRELSTLVEGFYRWEPLLGKQLLFGSLVSRTSVATELGLGLVSSNYFDESAPDIPPNGQPTTNVSLRPGATINYNIFNNLQLSIAVDSMFLLGTPRSYEVYLGVYGGPTLSF